METPIYPKIKVIETSTSFSLITTLRKEKDGEWYDWDCVESYKKNDDVDFTCKYKVELINRFHSTVYNIIVLGRIDTKQTDMYGERFFRKSEKQNSEEERLKQLLML